MPLIRAMNQDHQKPIQKRALKSFLLYVEKNTQFQAWKLDTSVLFDKLLRKDDISLKHLMALFYEEYAQQNGKVIWGDKTPSFFRMLRKLHALFPNARFVNVVRDGRDVYLSMRNMIKSRDNIAVAALEWRYKVHKTKKLLGCIPSQKVYEVRYEDLVTDPQSKIKEICSFLNIQYETEMLSFWRTSQNYISKEHSDLIFQPISSNNLFKWKNVLSDREKKIFGSIANDCLKKMDYYLENKNPGIHYKYYAKLLILLGIPRRLFEVLSTMVILKIASLFGVGTKAAGRGGIFNK